MAALQPLAPQRAIFSAATYQLDATKAARELALQLDREEIGFVIFFCSSAYDLDALGREMRHAFTRCEVMGCTTAGRSPPRATPKVVSVRWVSPAGTSRSAAGVFHWKVLISRRRSCVSAP